MTNDDDKRRPRLVITERESSTKPTSNARSSLYRLIARFRKNAQQADERTTQSVFNFAADILTGLTRLFRIHEKQHEDDPSSEDDEART